MDKKLNDTFRTTDVTSHRNGIGGQPFWSVRFSFEEGSFFYPNMVAIVPDNDKATDLVECYVLDLNNPMLNFRGDHFVDLVRKAIRDYLDALRARWEAAVAGVTSKGL